MLFAPFFAGAAGTGHVWWWRQAIEAPNQWHHFAHFASMIDGIDPAAEPFVVSQRDKAPLRVDALRGNHTLLFWLRDSRCDWKAELVERRKPARGTGTELDLTPYELEATTLEAARCRAPNPWNGQWTELRPDRARLSLPLFSRSLVVRIDLP